MYLLDIAVVGAELHQEVYSVNNQHAAKEEGASAKFFGITTGF